MSSTTRNGAGSGPGAEVKTYSTLSREEVVLAALRVIERDSIDGLTMRKLADELGASPMAAYHHIPDKKKSTLINLVLEYKISRVEIPPRDAYPWDVRLTMIGDSLEKELEGYPGLASAAIGQYSPSSEHMLQAVVTALEDGGFPPEMVVQTCMTLHALWFGADLIEKNLQAGVEDFYTRMLIGPGVSRTPRNFLHMARSLVIEGLKASRATPHA